MILCLNRMKLEAFNFLELLLVTLKHLGTSQICLTIVGLWLSLICHQETLLITKMLIRDTQWEVELLLITPSQSTLQLTKVCKMALTIGRVLSQMLLRSSSSFSLMGTEALPLNNILSSNNSNLKVRVMANLKIYSGAEVSMLDIIHTVTVN